MKGKIPALAKRSLAFALALALLLSLCPVLPLTAKATAYTDGAWYLNQDNPAKTNAWINIAFNTEAPLVDGVFVYEGNEAYDWTITAAPTKSVPATVSVKATITDADGNVVGGEPVFLSAVPIYKVSDAKPYTTMFSAAEYAALTADMVGTFTLLCELQISGTTYASYTQKFSRVAGGSEVETTVAPETEATEAPEIETTVATEPEEELKIGWEYAPGYDWLVADFTSADEDLVFEADQPYDWKFTLQQKRTTVELDVTATVYDSNRKTVESITKKATGYKSDEPSEIVTFADFTKLDNLNGEFILICEVYYNGNPVGKMTQVFSRTGAAGDDGEGEGEGEEELVIGWEYAPTYDWLVADFAYANDLAYEGDEAYDWQFTLQQARTTVDLNVTAVVKNANGETVAQFSGVKTAAKSDIPSVILTAADLPDLAGVNGEFTLICEVYYGTSPVGKMVQVFSRTGAAGDGGEGEGEGEGDEIVIGWEYASGYDWIVSDFTYANDLAYEGDEAYDWQFTLQQARTNVDLGIEAVVTDANGNVVAQYSGTKTCYKSATPSVMLTADDLADLTTDLYGEFLLVATVIYNGNPIGRMTQMFSRKGFEDESTVFTATAYLDLLQEVVMEEMSDVRGFNFTSNAPLTIGTIKSGDLVAWNMGPNIALLFTLSEEFMKGFDGKATVIVEYVESSQGAANLVYNNKDGEQVVSETITLSGQSTMKILTATFELTDASFVDVYGKGASFAIYGNPDGNGRFYLKSVTVKKPEPADATKREVVMNTNTDLVFYDDEAFDMNVVATTDGKTEVVNVTYTLNGGNMAEALTETKAISLKKSGTTILNAAWFNENAIGFGEFTLTVTLSNEKGELFSDSYSFLRTYSSILDTELISSTGDTNEDGVIMFGEDATIDLSVAVTNKLSVPFNGYYYCGIYKDEVCVAAGEGPCNDLTVTNIVVDASELTEYGVYDLRIEFVDENRLVAHENVFQFALVKEQFVSANTSSESAGETLVFMDDQPFDLVLDLQKEDGYEDTLTFAYQILKDGEVVKSGSFEQHVGAIATYALRATPSTAIDLSEILADVEGYGDFTLELTVTNTLGQSNEFSFSFSRIESVTIELISATNPGLVFHDDEVFDVQVLIKSATGENYVYSVECGTLNSQTGLDHYLELDQTITTEGLLITPDIASVKDFDTYYVEVVLYDADFEVVKEVTLYFSRVPSIESGVSFADAKEVSGIPTYNDLIPYNISVSLKKGMGNVEQMTINYTVTDKDGNEIIVDSTTANVGSTEAVWAPLDLSLLSGYGEYTLNIVVLDAMGSVAGEYSTKFARVETITSSLTSESNSDLVFTEGDEFDLQLTVSNSAYNVTALPSFVITLINEGVEVDSYDGHLTSITFTRDLSSFVDLTKLPATGSFDVNVYVADAEGRLLEDSTYTFYRVAAEGNVEATIESASNPTLTFTPDGEIDLTLTVEKTDGIAEGFNALLTVTDSNGNVVAEIEDSVESGSTYSLSELLSDIQDAGAYTINLTLTDNAGNVRYESSTAITLVSTEGSVTVQIGSSSNPDLIFTEGEDFDIVLQFKKTDGVAEAFMADVTITDENGVELASKLDQRVTEFSSLKVYLQQMIDLEELPDTGTYVLNVVLRDRSNNVRLDFTHTFYRVKLASVKTQVSSNTNKDMIFINADTVDLTLYVQKTDGIDEELYIEYYVLDPNGNEIGYGDGKTVVPSGTKYFKQPIELDPADTAAYGKYTVELNVYDLNGNVRSETKTSFIRISGSAGELKHQVSGSSSGTKMQFTPGMTLDLCLFLQKLDGVPESMPGELYVIAPSGAVVYSISGNLNVKAEGYFKFSLPLNGLCNEFGTYTVNYTIKDDAGNLRASNSVKFKIISPTGDVAVAVQSASSKFPGLIYGKDDAFDLVLYVQKADGVEQTLQLRYTIYDMNGLVLETKEGKVNAPALGYRKLPIELPDIEAFNKYGIFTIKVEIAGPTGQMIYNESFSFSRVLTPEKQLSVMGVCTHLSKKGMTTKQSQQYVDLARTAGISFWRDELPWSTVEPAKGQYRIPDSADAAVDYTLSIGLEPLFILDYGNDNYGSDVTTDEWLQGYLGYVEYMVTHFKGRIKYYEVWNEWNIGLGGMDKKYRDMADVYAKILIETYKVIKAIDPTITVIGGVVAGGEEKWTENFLKCPGAIDAMDVFSYHEYPDNDVKEFIDQAETVRALLTKYGRPDIPMWVTETGFPTHIGRNSFSEETSAGNLVSLYTWAIANPDVLDHIFWYDLHNDGVERENGEHNFGLLRNWNSEAENVPMAAKPSYVALCAMNSILADAEFVGMYDLGHKKISAYHFKKDGKDLLVAWADDQALNMIANVGENNIIVTDMYGNASALTPVDGKVSLFFSDAPIYIEYDLTNKLEMVEGGFELDKDQYSVTPAVTFPVKITRNNGLETQSGSYAFSMPDTWSVEGIEFGAAEAGATEIVDTVYVTVGDDASKGEMTITARVVIGGNVVGQFNVPIEMGDICTVNPDVVFTENGPEFKVSVKVLNEQSNKPLTGTINLLAPEALLGEASSIPFEIPAGENKAVLIDVPAEYANTYHTVKLEVVLNSGAKHAVTKPMSFLYAIEAPKDMKLDGVVDEQWDGAMEFSMGEDEWYNTTDSDAEWPGNTAKGYAMWDSEYLYVAVEAYDASHYQTGTGTSIWMGDSIQLTTDIARFTVPGYHGFNEVGFSLNSENGTVENWNWFASPGKNVSQGGIFTIVRDEANCITSYEVAIPWNELLPTGVEFDFRSIGFALIVNENSIDEDGEVTGRTGWIEYMSGIGYRKEPEKFGDLILVNRSEIQ